MRLFGNAIQQYYGALTLTAPAGFNPLTINATPGISNIQIVGGAAAQINVMQLTQGAQSPWLLYQPASSTDLRWFSNSADRMTLTAAGGATFSGGVTATSGSFSAALAAVGLTSTGGLTSSGGALSFTGAMTVTDSTGSVWGSPTGGAKGAGTINVAGGLFVNGVAVSTSSGGSLVGIVQIGFNGGSAPTILFSHNLGASPTVTRSAIGTYAINHNMGLGTNYVMAGSMNAGGAPVFIPQMNVSTTNTINLVTFSSGVGVADPANTYVLNLMITAG